MNVDHHCTRPLTQALQSLVIVTMAPAVTYFLGLFGILQAITATPVSVCQLQWGGATVDGHLGSGNVCRYNIKYGQAERWGESSAVAT